MHERWKLVVPLSKSFGNRRSRKFQTWLNSTSRRCHTSDQTDLRRFELRRTSRKVSWRLYSKCQRKKLSGADILLNLHLNIRCYMHFQWRCWFSSYFIISEISVGPSAHYYVTFAGRNHIDRSEIQANQQNKGARINERLARKEAQDIDDAAGSLLYEAAIDDSV